MLHSKIMNSGIDALQKWASSRIAPKAQQRNSVVSRLRGQNLPEITFETTRVRLHAKTQPTLLLSPQEDVFAQFLSKSVFLQWFNDLTNLFGDYPQASARNL